MDTVIIAIPFFKTLTPQLWLSSTGSAPTINTLPIYEADHPSLETYRPIETFRYSKPIPVTTGGYEPSSLYIRYLPKSKRWSKWEVVIEFSITKLLLGNNVEELPASNNADRVTVALANLLERVGIEVNFDQHTGVFWSRTDFSRNFPLTNCTTDEMIRPLIRLSPGVAYQTFYENYTNGGFRDARYNKQRYSIIYDKMAEALSYPARHPKLNPDSVQHKLSIGLIGSSTQILRIECRLIKTEAVTRELTPLLNHKQPYTFEEMMNLNTSRYVMGRYVEKQAGKNRLKALLLLEAHGEQELARLLKISAHVHRRHYKSAWITYVQLITKYGETEAAKEMVKHVSIDTVRNYRNAINEVLTVIELEHPIWSEYLSILQNIAGYKALALRDVLPQSTCDSHALIA